MTCNSAGVERTERDVLLCRECHCKWLKLGFTTCILSTLFLFVAQMLFLQANIRFEDQGSKQATSSQFHKFLTISLSASTTISSANLFLDANMNVDLKRLLYIFRHKLIRMTTPFIYKHYSLGVCKLIV